MYYTSGEKVKCGDIADYDGSFITIMKVITQASEEDKTRWSVDMDDFIILYGHSSNELFIVNNDDNIDFKLVCRID